MSSPVPGTQVAGGRLQHRRFFCLFHPALLPVVAWLAWQLPVPLLHHEQQASPLHAQPVQKRQQLDQSLLVLLLLLLLRVLLWGLLPAARLLLAELLPVVWLLRWCWMRAALQRF
jgi:hypothetical protein